MKTILSIRFDDVCPTMDYSQFYKGLDVMRKYGIKPLIGVIPDNKDLTQCFNDENENYWEMLRQLQNDGYVIAMHGFEHVYDVENAKNIVCYKKHSEFAGHSYESQYKKIKKGKEILEKHGIKTNVFFAPGHTYDRNTLKALFDNGFVYNIDGLSKKPYKQEGVLCVPCRSFGVSKIRKNQINIAVIHPNEWNVAEKKDEYDKLVDFCEKNNVSDFSLVLQIHNGMFLYQKTLEKLYKFYLFKLKKLLLKIIRR